MKDLASQLFENSEELNSIIDSIIDKKAPYIVSKNQERNDDIDDFSFSDDIIGR